MTKAIRGLFLSMPFIRKPASTFRGHALAATFTAAIFAAAATPAPGWAEEMEVKIDNFTFAPQQIKVKAGTTVTWVNEDDIPHAIASTTKAFRSKALDTDDKYSFTFTTPGVYE